MSTETNAKPVPKSLHTVTVIVQVAAGFIETGSSTGEAIDAAMGILCLAGRDDPHGLRDAALLQVNGRPAKRVAA